MSDTALTISPLRVSPLSENEQAAFGMTHKYNVQYSDIAYGSASADTVTLTLGTTPTKFIVDKAAVNVKTAFAGTTALAIIVGTTGTTNGFIASTSVLTAAFVQPSTGKNTLATIASGTATAATAFQATFTNSTGGSPSALSAGELDIYLSMRDSTRLP